MSEFRDERRPERLWPPADEEQELEARSFPTDLRDYDPIHPQGFTVGNVFRRLWAVIVGLALAAIKFGAFMIKFFGIFISVGGYALIWGWRFAVGFVGLILIHEAGHYFEARRQGLHPALPVFIPFLGAYVAIKDAPREPWRNGLISLAGPIVGGLGAVVFWVIGDAIDSRLIVALAYTAFLINLINLLPVVPLDGGFTWGAIRALIGRRADPAFAGRKGQGIVLATMYLSIAALLALGMYATHVPQDRL